MLTKILCISTSMLLCTTAFADCCTKEEKVPVQSEQTEELVQNDEERRINEEQEDVILADADVEEENQKEKEVLPLANGDIEKKQEESEPEVA